MRREHRVDVVPVFGDHRLHHLLALHRAPVRVNGIQNLDARIGAENLHRRLDPVLVRARSGLAAQDDHVTLAVQLLDDPLREQPAHHRVGGGDEGDEIVGIDAAVDHDHRNAPLGNLRDSGVERLRGIGADDQKIDAARYQILNIGNLLGVVMSGVGNQELLDDVGVVMRGLLQRVQPTTRQLSPRPALEKPMT